MNQLKEEIMSLIESRQGFTEISDQLNNEIPQMLLQLRNYYREDRAFYDIVLQIRNRWGPVQLQQSSAMTQAVSMQNQRLAKAAELVTSRTQRRRAV